MTGVLLAAAIWMGMPPQLVLADCGTWEGGGLDDAPYQSLFPIGAPLQGRDNIDRAAARQLLEAWNAAGQPANFDLSPYIEERTQL